MSLFIQLYEKIAPIAKDEKAARELADVLADAVHGKLDDYATKADILRLEMVTKKDIEVLRIDLSKLEAKIFEAMNKQTWMIIGAMGVLGAIIKLVPGR
jgi:hypothetical protein